jgi:hypothetical protein
MVDFIPRSGTLDLASEVVLEGQELISVEKASRNECRKNEWEEEGNTWNRRQ